MVNQKETIVTPFNCHRKVNLKTSDGFILNEVNDFTYLVSMVSSSKANIARRIYLAWAAHGQNHFKKGVQMASGF